MNLEEIPKKSKQQEQLDKGKAKVGNQERKIAKVVRKTKEGKQIQSETEEKKKKNDLLIKATLKQKNEQAAEQDDGWESVEEDYPHI